MSDEATDPGNGADADGDRGSGPGRPGAEARPRPAGGATTEGSTGEDSRLPAPAAGALSWGRERVPVRGSDAAVGVLAGVAGVAASYAVAGLSAEFVAGPVVTVLSFGMPGQVITFAILVLGDLGQKLNLLTAVGLTVGLLAAVTVAGRELGRRANNRAAAVLGPPVAAGTLAAALTGGAGGSALATAGGVAMTLALADGAGTLPFGTASGAVTPARRRVLGAAAAVLGAGALGALFGRGTATLPDGTGVGADGEAGDDDRFAGPGDGLPDGAVTLAGVDADRVRGLIEEADRKRLDVPGIEGLLSEGFYEVDVNGGADPVVDADEWTLSVTGAVEREVTYDYADLREREPEHRFVSLRCVGEPLNGKKLDTALWTGVPAMDLVEPADPQGGYVFVRAADGYYQEFPIEALRNGSFLAYGMNGKPLPVAHGYPVRMLVPGHWGEINVKWITEIEIRDDPAKGYWEKKGWHGTGPVHTVAKIHHVDRSGGRVELAGHAYAGLRGVSAVEVSTDGGDTWSEATLSEPLPGEDVWRQWVYRYDPPGDTHVVFARTIEEDGTVQPREFSRPFPSGATGWVSKRIDGRSSGE